MLLALSVPIAATMAVASAVGAFGGAYARETPSWAAQGTGQDLANLFLIAPLLLVVAALAARGSFRALLVWMGFLLYVIYSYVLYAFSVHFNALFLVYIATLGVAFYALAGAVLTIDLDAVAAACRRQTHEKSMGLLLIVVGVLFAALWLTEIIGAMLKGTAPASAAEVGLPVNPIHTLDLAFALPGAIIAGVLVRRRHPLGLLFAVPCATFLIVMGVAILAMALVMALRGVPGGGLPVPIVITIAAAGYVTARFLADVSSPGGSGS